MKPVLLNFSGHALNTNAKNSLLEKYDEIEEIPFVEIDFASDVGEKIEEILRNVQTRLDGSLPIAIIPPGQSTFAILLVTYLHGLLGYFPSVCYMQAVYSGWYEPSAIFHIDGYGLRKAGRNFRQELWKDSSTDESS